MTFQTESMNRRLVKRTVFEAVRELEAQELESFLSDITAPRADEMFTDLGTQVAGEFIAPASTATSAEPTDTGFYGAGISADGKTWGNTVYHVFAVAAGILGVGFNALGQLLAAAGAYVMDALGVTITGVDFVENHYATVGAYTRRHRRGFQATGGYPVYKLEFIGDAGGSEIITSNPGFESNDFTGFTQSDTVAGAAWAITTASKHAGTYAALFDPNAATGTATIVSDKYATTAASRYTFSVWTRFLTTSGLTIQARWYNAVPTLLQTDTIFSGTGTLTGWIEKAATFEAPSGSTQVEFYVTITFADFGARSTGILYLDDFSILPIGTYSAIRFDDNGISAITADGTFDLVSGNVVRKTATTTVTSNTTPANDAELKFSAIANEIYSVEVFLVLIGNGVGDFKFGWSVPASCTMLWQGITQINDVGASGTPTAALIESDTLAIGSGAGTTFLTKLEGIVINGANAGTVNLQWSQNFSNGTASQVLVNSHLIYRKIG